MTNILIATYILWTASTGQIITNTSSLNYQGGDLMTDSSCYMVINTNELQTGYTTQYISGVTCNTNDITDLQIVTKQTSKSQELKIIENNYLLICSNLTGSITNKLTLQECQAELDLIKKGEKSIYEDIRDNLLYIDQCGQKINKDWWNTCEWHPEVTLHCKTLPYKIENIRADQQQKAQALIQLVGLYKSFLKNEWTVVLKDRGLIQPDQEITVSNTDSGQNMLYLMQLRGLDNIENKPTYSYYKNEFQTFRDNIERLGGDMSNL